MRTYEQFAESIGPFKGELEGLQHATPQSLSPSDWKTLERAFKAIKVMATETAIVGHSKVLAHLLPNLVAPIDREYTFKYLLKTDYVPNDIGREWNLTRKIHEEFYYPVSDNEIFQSKAKTWMGDSKSFPWDTSLLKVIENLVIGAMQK